MISVVIPTYNRINFIEKAVLSVLNQTYRDFEILIIDDGSLDETVNFIKEKFSKEITEGIIRVFENSHNGISATRNKGVAEAKGDFIAFLDSDDTWNNKKLEFQMKYLSENPSCPIVFTKYQNLLPDGNVISQEQLKLSNEQCEMYVASSLVRKEVFNIAGMFDVSLERGEDYEWACRAKMCGIDVSHCINEILYNRNIHDSNISLNHDSNDFNEIKSLWMIAMRNAVKQKRKNNES